MESTETNEQAQLREFLKLLGDLQTKGKITGKEFREYRELWIHQQPNDRDVSVWHLKQLLNTETKINPKETIKQPPQKRQKL
jgi:hypothetical protein